MSSPEETVTKGEFAALCKVSAAAVSQWIRDGKITPDALVGDGRWARIRVALAMRQVGLRRDIGQALGNGIGTRLARSSTPHDGEDAEPFEGWSPDGSSDAIDRRLKEAKLEAAERDNRIKAAEEAASKGLYTETTTVRSEMGKISGRMVAIFEGALPEIASALAASLKAEEREVLHALNEQFRKVREQASEAAAEIAAKLAEDVEASA